MFLSLVRPDRISSPITRMAAVTTADGSLISNPPAVQKAQLVPPQNPLPRLSRPLKRADGPKTGISRGFWRRCRGGVGIAITAAGRRNLHDLLLRHSGARWPRDDRG